STVASVVVVGGGFAGLSAAVRIAKLRHQVTLLEAADDLGGQLRPLVRDGFSFDHGYSVLTVPATLRDLFRKSGRPLERVLDLQHLSPARRHVFRDGAALDLPTGSRSAQTEAVNSLGGRLGEEWTGWLDGFADVWDTLRRC